ncbi:LOW QUALITY PROTEIN: stabilizer of axonemal microtubules 4 [Strix uralensis]|uniref:LOW QUALITY PROTEIN: stabilizer of axonemal microtubules 4 n=1 Tax=Strix uralensis TaxID=36305 RepID=UPI003DA2EF5D
MPARCCLQLLPVPLKPFSGDPGEVTPHLEGAGAPSSMASARPFVCPRAEPRALAQDSPAAGLGAVSPSVKARADLMNFYAMTYAVAHASSPSCHPGQLRFRPHFGHRTESGYVSNNHPTISCLLCPRSAAQGHCQDTATSTTADHFKPFWLPDGRSLLPQHIQQLGSGYPHGSSLPFLCIGAVSPRHTRLPQGSPKASRKHSTRSCCTGPAQPGMVLGVWWWWSWGQLHPQEVLGCRWFQGQLQAQEVLGVLEAPCPASPLPADPQTQGSGRAPRLCPATNAMAGCGWEKGGSPLPCLLPTDVLQKTTIGTKEQSGFTRATPRSDHVLPALPAQPLGFSITMTDFLPSACSHGSEMLLAGSERGSGFSREARRCLGTATLPAVGHPVVVVSRGLQAPRVTQAGLLGQQVAGRKELSGFTKTHGQYVTPRPTLSRAAPARCWRDPTWMAKNGGIQPQRPSSFSTNNCPTGLGDIVGHCPV